MGVADDSSLLVLEEVLVVRPSENGLQAEQGANNSAHLGVCVFPENSIISSDDIAEGETRPHA